MGLIDLLCGGWSALVFLFLYLPILLLVVFSFNKAKGGAEWTGFTFHWYSILWQNESLIEAARNSLLIALITTLVSIVIGTVGAWLLHRYRFPGTRVLNTLILVPVIIPEVIMGVSLLILFSILQAPLNAWLATFTEAEFERGLLTVIISHVTFCFPFVLVAVQARLSDIDPFLEEAALDLGATPLQAFWLVIVPYLFPAIISGALMSFTLSLDEVIVTFFTSGPGSQTLPLKIFGLAKKGLDPSLNAISAIFIAVTILLVVLAEKARKLNHPAPFKPFT
ncbi:MAG: Ornithine carbamoyltransferase [Chthoniobacteraceae bacterium]|nr:Ornithine carbamoyltransferase [Chthoniobacteraceae bacterium]